MAGGEEINKVLQAINSRLDKFDKFDARMERIEKNQFDNQVYLDEYCRKNDARVASVVNMLNRRNRDHGLETYDDDYDVSSYSQPRRNNYDDDRGVKLDLPEFSGDMDPEVFLEWVSGMERVFEYKGFDEKKKYKLAIMKMSKYAAIWFDNLKAQRRRNEKEKIDTWEKLKKKDEGKIYSQRI